MQLITFRNPGYDPEGNLSLREREFFASAQCEGTCWYTEGTEIIKQAPERNQVCAKNIDDRTAGGHQAYCLEFLWPVLHDMPQMARYYPANREAFHRFNAMVAQTICEQPADASAGLNVCLVNDYQFALLPLFFKLEAGKRSTVAWRLPWPQAVLRQHSEPLMAIARALLSSDRIVFLTAQHAQNFASFVQEFLPAQKINEEQLCIGSACSYQSLASSDELMQRGRVGSANGRGLRRMDAAQLTKTVEMQRMDASHLARVADQRRAEALARIAEQRRLESVHLSRVAEQRRVDLAIKEEHEEPRFSPTGRLANAAEPQPMQVSPPIMAPSLPTQMQQAPVRSVPETNSLAARLQMELNFLPPFRMAANRILAKR